MPESEEIIIGNKLKEARIRKGFSIEELADILSLSIPLNFSCGKSSLSSNSCVFSAINYFIAVNYDFI